jgi:two-component system, LytTR family, response regulator
LAYLLKPFSLSDLIEVVKTASNIINTKNDAVEAKLIPKNALIIMDTRNGKVVLKHSDIWYCKADGSISYLYVWKNNQLDKISTPTSIGQIEKRLPEEMFYRVHHSYIVNLACIERFQHTGRNGVIYLQNGIIVPVSVKKMQFFMGKFKSFWE